MADRTPAGEATGKTSVKPPPLSEVEAVPAGSSSDWKYWAFAVGILEAFYLLLSNHLWTPGNDCSYYVAVARSVALGNGLTFNGGPVALVPPGWPLFLAGLLSISPTFAFIGLATGLCLALSAGVWFWLLRRFVSAKKAFVTILLTGLLYDWYSRSFQYDSEALFCLAFSSALLLAAQISEGRKLRWRLPLFLVLCAASVSVRWAGFLSWPLVGGSLVSGQFRPRWNRQWLCLGLSVLVTAGAFFGLRYLQTKVLPGKSVLSAVEVLGTAGGLTEDWVRLSSGREVIYHLLVSPQGRSTLSLENVGSAGVWWIGLLWPPATLAMSSPLLTRAVNPLGWLLILAFIATAAREAVRGRWVWLAVMVYSLVLILRWTNIQPRYLMPVAPVILLGIWAGIEWLIARIRSARIRALLRGGAILLVAATVLLNLALYVVDVTVARSRDYYKNYYSGKADGLVAAAFFLNGQSVADGEIAVSPTYSNLNRTRDNSFALRCMYLLTNRGIRSAPSHLEAPSEELIRWAKESGVRYYLYRPPVSPWQLWHFRAPWLQKLLSGSEEISQNPNWELYEIVGDGARRMDLPPASGWPTEVPGMRWGQ